MVQLHVGREVLRALVERQHYGHHITGACINAGMLNLRTGV